MALTLTGRVPELLIVILSLATVICVWLPGTVGPADINMAPPTPRGLGAGGGTGEGEVGEGDDWGEDDDEEDVDE